MTTTIKGGEAPADGPGGRLARGAELPLPGLCRLARALFQVPVAAVTLEREGGWIDLDEGLNAGDWAFAIAAEPHPDDGYPPAMIEDARHDPCYAGYRYVDGPPYLRFVASAPICVGAGAPEGRVALFDTVPRPFGAEQMRRLEELAALAGECLRLYREGRDAARREAHYRLLAESSTDTIVRGNLDGVRLYVSPAVRTLLGYEPDELIGRRALDITHPDDVVEFGALMARLREGKLELAVSEQRQRHKDGSWVWLEASIRLTCDPATGLPDGYVASVRGIGRRKQAEARLMHIARHDALTGLANRKLFGERLGAEIARAESAGPGFALLYMDIDHFKQINDGLGHGAGDAVLRTVATRLLASVGGQDMVARLGGDEFALLQIGGDRRAAAALAERLIAAVSHPVAFEGRPISVGLSIGIACSGEHELDADRLMAAADQALYLAKSAGRRTFRFAPVEAPADPPPAASPGRDHSASGI
ncbi:diguanylate cyclase domain-containing protein [Ancylobacter sp. G4_0304]|uniref:diguanylate cyclase domain-containing protein n=1 Tax=Ancylobacter sp. G4_0304 TaxID=3114289 RepID=UPI0039C5CB70